MPKKIDLRTSSSESGTGIFIQEFITIIFSSIYLFPHHHEIELTKRFVVEYKLDPCGNISEDIKGKEENQGNGGNLIGQAHLQSWSGLGLCDSEEGQGGVNKAHKC